MSDNNNDNHSDIEYEDGDTFSMQKELSIKDLALNQYRVCSHNMSQEMHQGGVRKVMIQGKSQEIIMPDNIALFFRSVRTLEVTLHTYLLKYENELKEYSDKINEMNIEINKLIDESKTAKKFFEANFGNTTAIKYEQEFERLNKLILHKRILLHEERLRKLSVCLHLLNYFGERYGDAV